MAATDEKSEPNIVQVGKVKDDSRAVWDRWPHHPENYGQAAGEVFISDMRPYSVDLNSPGILQKMGEKELKELNEREVRTRTSEYEEARRAAAAAREQADEDDEDGEEEPAGEQNGEPKRRLPRASRQGRQETPPDR